MRVTQKEKVLRLMFRISNKEDRFVFPYEVISDGDIFIGYKAPTRFCELCIEHLDLIESKFEGKYRVGRIRRDNIERALLRLPDNLQKVVREECGIVEPKKTFSVDQF